MIVDRSASDVRLLVNAKGEALISYRARGTEKRVLAWGAVNAIPSARGAKQVAFEVDYTGRWGKNYLADPEVRELQSDYRRIRFKKGYLTSPTMKKLAAKSAFAKDYWRDSFGGTCGRYDGPPLAWFVAACKAPDGSYWALQAWQRMLPNYGLAASAERTVWELHLSHWTGPLPVLTIGMDWSWHRWDHLFGTVAYARAPVYGFASTPTGV